MADLDRDQVELLHDALVASWFDRLEEAKTNSDKPMSSSEYSSLAKFLKDNNVTAILSAKPAGQNILDSMPFDYVETSFGGDQD